MQQRQQPEKGALPPGRFTGGGKTAGLTLIEVLVALVLVSIGLLGIAGLQAKAIGANRTARLQTEATALAAGILEQMRLLPFDHPYLAAGTTAQRRMAAGGGSYAVHWTVIDDRPAAGTKTLQIRVSWPGAPHYKAVRLKTILAGSAHR